MNFRTEVPRKLPSGVVLLSGGLASATALFWAKQWFDTVDVVTFDEGGWDGIGINAARTVAHWAQVESHDVVALPPELLRTRPEELPPGSAGWGWVPRRAPFRDAVFLAVASNRARCLAARSVVTGLGLTADSAPPDHEGPDLRRCFLESYQLALGHGEPTAFIRFHAPLIGMTAENVVRMAMTLPACYEALALTHVSDEDPQKAALRAKGFAEAGVPDPLLARGMIESRVGRDSEAVSDPAYDVVRDILRAPKSRGLTAREQIAQLADAVGAVRRVGAVRSA